MSDDKISMNHGAGGEVMANLISSTILDNITKKSVNGGISLDALDDGASIPLGDDYEIVFTTDLWRMLGIATLVSSFFSGILIMILSILAEYIGQIMTEVRHRPTSLIYEYKPAKIIEERK